MREGNSRLDFFRARLETPNYEVGEAARYAKVSVATVTRWHQNTMLSARRPRLKLSYLQLIELAVVSACKAAGMKLREIRLAREFFAKEFKTPHPFAKLELKTDGVDLATRDCHSNLMIGNRSGQLAWNEVIGRQFRDFDYDGDLVSRWRVAGADSPIIIDPGVRFGSPHVAGVPTYLIYDRIMHGESYRDLAEDYEIPEDQLRAAVCFEGGHLSKAA
ncbi:putative antitoxin VapB45 [Candidatus Phycosocius bacilliformis]|uniref:Putative antitoxin VapB45 n=1 Tax=Candidatus Phycosocius bacilliformis TaxID=1445552 RepID=A0A2P2ECT9_9PROT|nr:DUF433 domain-containing protein [Candidatus Phycosocius bacilliformis]GBF58861.1 putative antitoxin VapB45 [Candidatus Phycosocius bacilliformis]